MKDSSRNMEVILFLYINICGIEDEIREFLNLNQVRINYKEQSRILPNGLCGATFRSRRNYKYKWKVEE